LLFAHYVAVPVWVESLRRLPAIPPEQRLPYYFGFANATIGVSALLTGLGYFLADAVPAPLGAGLLFLTPLFFTLSLIAGARDVVDRSAIALGFVLGPLSTLAAGRDLDLLVAGLGGGTAAYLIGRRRAAKPTDE
jgi:hypothetical protein